jgi:hypothetical protein
MTINLNVTPYHDDYDIDKGYLRVLYKPGNSVQARELTQQQTILQQQIANMGDHFFKEGSMVIPGSSAVDVAVPYIKVTLAEGLNTAAEFVGKVIQGDKTGIRAIVISYADAVDLNQDAQIDSDDEPTTLFVKYLDGVAGGQRVVDGITLEIDDENGIDFVVNGNTVNLKEGDTSSFVEGEVLTATNDDGLNLIATVALSADHAEPLGKGSLAFVEEGIYFTQGFMVKNQSQSVILDKYDDTPSYKIGFEIQETVVSANEDPSLFDNAQGTTNYNAPGADRYRINLVWSKRTLDTPTTNNFIEIITVQDGIIKTHVRSTEYSVITDVLARRTYDESGDYTVRPFNLDIREYFKENGNGGVYTMKNFEFDTEVAAKDFALKNFADEDGMVDQNGNGLAHTVSALELIQFSDQNLDSTGLKYYPGSSHQFLVDAVRNYIALGVESGKAYVRGYEIAKTATTYIPYKRSRENFQVNNHYIPVDLGPYIYITDAKGLPLIDEEVKLVNMNISPVITEDYTIVTSNLDDADTAYFQPVTYDEDLTFFAGGGTNLGANVYGIDAIANAKVKAVEYFTDSDDDSIDDNYGASTFRPSNTSVETGIWKVFLYDIEYEINPRTNVPYTMLDARSIVSNEEVVPTTLGGSIYRFGANVLTLMSLSDVQGQFTLKSLIYDRYDRDVRAINYYYNSADQFLLVKNLNSGNGLSTESGVLPSATFVTNELINEAIASGSAGTDTTSFDGNASADMTGTQARITGKFALLSDGGASIIDTGKRFLQTVRFVDDESGRETVDTQYDVLKVFEDQTVTANGQLVLTATDDNSFFISTQSLYLAFDRADLNSSVGEIGRITSISFSSDRRTATLNVTNLPAGTTGVTVYAPIKKTSSREKIKTLRENQLHLPYTLVGAIGQTIGQTVYDNVNDANNDTSLSYGVDLLGSNSSVATGVVNSSIPTGANNDLILSVSNFQLPHSDVYEIKKIYDTCNVNNTSYRISIESNDRKFLHEMTEADFEFALKAYTFYETTGASPFSVDLDHTVYPTLVSIQPQLTVDGTVNPFKEEIEELWLSNVGIETPAEFPVKINDITDRYTLFSGQRHSIIQLGELELKAGTLPCGGRPIIIYSYFEHGSGDYASVDSYVNIPYHKIPSFEGVRLHSTLDFRPAAVYQQLSGYPYGKGVVSGISDYPIDASAISVDLRIYFGRADKLYMDKFGNINVKYGAPSETPVFPTDPEDGMVLYTLETLPYTGVPKDVSAKMIDNRRYTMRDIGKLDKRISNLEYYTSLNLLEKETKDLLVTDENGLDRFKNGFVVENFTGFGTANVYDSDFNASMDTGKGELRPFFTTKNIPMHFDVINSEGFEVSGRWVTLPYTSQLLIEQRKSSKTVNVNPFAIFSFKGSMVLVPSTDNWHDDPRYLDTIEITERGNADNFEELAQRSGILGTVWGSWETSWTGTTNEATGTSARTESRGNNDRTVTTTTNTWSDTGTRTRTGVTTALSESWTPVTTDKLVSSEQIPFIRTRDVYFKATGMKPNTKLFAFFDNTLVSDYVTPIKTLNITNVPPATAQYIKNNRNIFADQYGELKLRGQSTAHEVFVADIDYLDATSLKLYVLENVPGKKNTSFSLGEVLFLVERDGKSHNMGSFPNEGIVGGSTLRSDSAGTVYGNFSIPNNNQTPNDDDLKFRTGERVFKLCDQPNGNLDDSDTDTNATYTARGIIETRQKTTVNTKTVEIVDTVSAQSEDVVSELRSSSNSSFGNWRQVRGWGDPLAQSFLVDVEGGAFITSAEIFFSAKDGVVPVTLQIRNMVNGYPGQYILGEKMLDPRQDLIQLSDDGSLETIFTFDEPVYLEEATEYCLVLIANTQGYRVHVATLGQESLDGSGIISEQPYAGVFFKSQNASTWTAEQKEDLKFTLSRAKFDINRDSSLYFTNSEIDVGMSDINVMERIFDGNSMFVHKDSSLITFKVNDSSGCVPTSFWQPNGYNYVTLKNFHGTYDQYSAADLNGSHLVVATTYNSFTIDMRGFFYPEGVRTPRIAHGGAIPSVDSVFTPASNTFSQFRQKKPASWCTNIKYDLMKPNITSVELAGTGISMKFKALTGTSQDSTEAPGVKDLSFKGITPNQNYTFNRPMMVADNYNETLFDTSSNSLDKKSLIWRVDLVSNKDNLSPIIDKERIAAVLVSNVTNSAESVPTGVRGHVNTGFVNETNPHGGSAATKYITREIKLDQSSTSLKVLGSVYRPDVTDVDFYYKIKTSPDQNFEKIDYVLLDRPAVYSKASKDISNYKEFDYEVRNLPEFNSVAIKIVLKSKNSSVVPKVRDFRVIALAT